MATFRNGQIDDILNYDRSMNRIVLDRMTTQVSQFNDEKARPTNRDIKFEALLGQLVDKLKATIAEGLATLTSKQYPSINFRNFDVLMKTNTGDKGNQAAPQPNKDKKDDKQLNVKTKTETEVETQPTEVANSAQTVVAPPVGPVEPALPVAPPNEITPGSAGKPFHKHLRNKKIYGDDEYAESHSGSGKRHRKYLGFGRHSLSGGVVPKSLEGEEGVEELEKETEGTMAGAPEATSQTQFSKTVENTVYDIVSQYNGIIVKLIEATQQDGNYSSRRTTSASTVQTYANILKTLIEPLKHFLSETALVRVPTTASLFNMIARMIDLIDQSPPFLKVDIESFRDGKPDYQAFTKSLPVGSWKELSTIYYKFLKHLEADKKKMTENLKYVEATNPKTTPHIQRVYDEINNKFKTISDLQEVITTEFKEAKKYEKANVPFSYGRWNPTMAEQIQKIMNSPAVSGDIEVELPIEFQESKKGQKSGLPPMYQFKPGSLQNATTFKDETSTMIGNLDNLYTTILNNHKGPADTFSQDALDDLQDIIGKLDENVKIIQDKIKTKPESVDVRISTTVGAFKKYLDNLNKRISQVGKEGPKQSLEETAVESSSGMPAGPEEPRQSAAPAQQEHAVVEEAVVEGEGEGEGEGEEVEEVEKKVKEKEPSAKNQIKLKKEAENIKALEEAQGEKPNAFIETLNNYFKTNPKLKDTTENRNMLLKNEYKFRFEYQKPTDKDELDTFIDFNNFATRTNLEKTGKKSKEYEDSIKKLLGKGKPMRGKGKPLADYLAEKKQVQYNSMGRPITNDDKAHNEELKNIKKFNINNPPHANPVGSLYPFYAKQPIEKYDFVNQLMYSNNVKHPTNDARGADISLLQGPIGGPSTGSEKPVKRTAAKRTVVTPQQALQNVLAGAGRKGALKKLVFDDENNDMFDEEYGAQNGFIPEDKDDRFKIPEVKKKVHSNEPRGRRR